MKKIFLVLILCFSFWLTSCAITENIYFNKDGSGKFSVDIDGSSLMTMVPKDSLKQGQKTDSTYTLKQLFEEKKDSIAKLPKIDQEKLKKFEGLIVRMQSDMDKNIFLISMNTDFKSADELPDLNSIAEVLNNIDRNPNNISPLELKENYKRNNSVLKYSYDGEKFIRKATINKANPKELVNDSIKIFKSFFKDSKYIVKYHFPKPIIKVSNTTALLSEDRKTVTIEFQLDDYLESPEKLNFEVEFE